MSNGQFMVLLVKCPRSHFSHFEENSEALSLAYLASALRSAGFYAEILDAALLGLSLPETIEGILSKPYNLIGFTILDPTYFRSTFEIINSIRTKGVRAHITIGGYAPTFNWKEVLQSCPQIDSVVRYEGERTIVELASALRNETGWQNIQNLAFRKGEKFIATPIRPLVKDLDSLNFPSRDTLPYILKYKRETGVVSIYSSRGCYENCNFCSIRSFYNGPFGKPWRTRSAKNIADEIEHLVSNWNVREIVFVDDIFIGPGKIGIKRIYELAEEVQRRNLQVMFSISERVDNVSYKIFKKLYDMGVRQCLLGIEAGTQESLDALNKKTTVDQNKFAIRLFHQLGIDPTVSFINFSLKTTIEELRTNLDFLLSLNVNFLQGLLNKYTIYYGTPLAIQLEKEGKIKGSFPDYAYDFEDRRVDVAYYIVQNSLGPFLSIAYELKRIERKIRLKMFEFQTKGNCISELRKGKKLFKSLEASIMKEASDIFSCILDFSENINQPQNKDIHPFISYIADLAQTKFVEWKNEIEFFEKYAPWFVKSTEEMYA